MLILETTFSFSCRKLLNVENHKQCLNATNYIDMLNLLLYLEEHQMNMNIRDYDTESTELKKLKNDFFRLEVSLLTQFLQILIGLE